MRASGSMPNARMVIDKEKCMDFLFFPVDIRGLFRYNIQDFGVWRSLVSRLVRVQEASGSNPDTPTMASVLIAFETL